MERVSHSRIWREVGGQVGKSKLWDRDKKCRGERMNSFYRQRFWDSDGRRPIGQIDSCGRYVGY